MWYPYETHLKLKYRRIWNVHKIYICCTIILKFCTDDDSNTAKPDAHFENDLETAKNSRVFREILVYGEFEMISHIATACTRIAVRLHTGQCPVVVYSIFQGLYTPFIFCCVLLSFSTSQR